MRCILLVYLKIIIFIHNLVGKSINAVPAIASTEKELRIRALPFEDCGSKYDVMYLDIDSCTKVPCSMKRNSVVKTTVVFDDNGNDISFLKNKVRWVFNYIKTEAYISPDPCDGNHACISNSASGKTYWANIYVNDSLPVMRGTMLWEAVDENNITLICFQVPILITT